MSVINTMLQDLERRRVDLGHAGAFRYVRALPEGRDGRQGRAGLLVLAGAVLAAAVVMGPDLWKKLVQNVPQEGAAMARVAAAAPPVVVPATVAPPRLADSGGAQGLALTVSREMLWRESKVPDEPPPRAVAPASAIPTLTAARIAPALPAPAVPRSAIEAGPVPAGKGNAEPSDAVPTPPLKASSLSIERSSGSVGGASAQPNEIKQFNALQRNENEFRRGNELFGQGRAAQALEAYAQVLAWDPMHDAARQALVAAQLRGKNNTEAERLLVERQSMTPKNAGLSLTLARLQADRGDNDLALETLRASLPVAGNNPTYHATMAALLARLGQHVQAVTQYQAALRLAPQSGVWWMGLGLSLQAVGSLSEAQEALRRARASDNLTPELAAFVDQRLKQLH
jgi:MSHA biogenesis protein MshN